MLFADALRKRPTSAQWIMSNTTKTALLEAFRCVTLPYRLMVRRRYASLGQTPVVILYYHRVADTDPVAWSLTNDQFRTHIDWLQQRYDMVSLAEAQRRIREGNDRPAVHITFDDGYAENGDQALPMLIERQIPCTYFVTLDNVANAKPFVHDQNAGREFPVNTISQLRDLADQGIEIAAHTRTHPDLGQVDDLEVVYDEIVTAKRELSDLMGRPIRYFAFPFGMKPNLNDAAAAMARAEGIECILSAYGGYNDHSEDAFHLQRCHGDPELIRLRNAVTFDPRHIRKKKSILPTSGPAVAIALQYYHQRNKTIPNVASVDLTTHSIDSFPCPLPH